MADSINVGKLGDEANGGVAAFSLNYDEQRRATDFNCINNSPETVQGRIVGWDASDAEDPNKEFALIVPPGQSDSISIPLTGPKSFAVKVNDRGKIVGYNTYLG